MPKEARFEFVRVLTPVGFVLVPVARIRLTYDGRTAELEMTIDSGADLTMIPFQVGLVLGMKPGRSAVRRLSGVAGGIPYILRVVRLGIGPFNIKSRVAWAQLDDVPILLGRADVFNRFRITFDERRRLVAFRR